MNEENQEIVYENNYYCECSCDEYMQELLQKYNDQQILNNQHYAKLLELTEKNVNNSNYINEFQRYQTGFQLFMIVTILLVASYKFFKMFF